MTKLPEPNHSYLVKCGHGVYRVRTLKVDREKVTGIVTATHWQWGRSMFNEGSTITVRRCNASFQ